MPRGLICPTHTHLFFTGERRISAYALLRLCTSRARAQRAPFYGFGNAFFTKGDLYGIVDVVRSIAKLLQTYQLAIAPYMTIPLQNTT